MQNVRPGEELQIDNLKDFLKEQGLLEDTSLPMRVTQFSTGFSNLTYLLEVGEQEFVLRRPPAGAIKRGHDMSREYKVLSRLYKAFPKSPKAYAYTDDLSITGASFYIMEKVEGIIITYKEALKRQIPPQDFPVIAESWLDTLVELHAVDYDSIGLSDLGRPVGYVERQVTNWSKQYLKAATEEIPAAQQVMQWLADHQPRTYDHRLIHNDYKYDNVVFKDDSWKEVRAVLDWEMCTLGDPLMDMGTSIAYWSMPTDHPMILKGWPSPTALEGNPGRLELVERYAQKTGRSINHLVFYYAFGLFKIAVIVQQIYYRYSKGLTTDPRFANLNEATKLFCLMAFQAIRKGRVERLFVD